MTAPRTPRTAQDVARIVAAYARAGVTVRTVIDAERVVIEPVTLSQADHADPFDLADMSR